MLVGNKAELTSQQAVILPLRNAYTSQFSPLEENRKQQVCLSKDASEGKDENRITGRNYTDLIAAIFSNILWFEKEKHAYHPTN